MIASNYDAIIFDQWGVLHNGTTAYQDAIGTVSQLTVSCAVLSNSGKRSAPNAKRITEMGFSKDAFQFVMTSGEALWRDVANKSVTGRRFFAVERAKGDAKAWANGLDIELVGSPKEADAILMMGLPDGAELSDWTPQFGIWLDRELPMYCSNPDRQSPRSDGLVTSPGAIAFAYQAIGGETKFYGKPHLPIFNAIEQVLGAGRYLMVGDSMEHDIAGAQAAGWDSLLVQNGLYANRFAKSDPDKILQEITAENSCYPPTYTIESLR